MRHAYDFKTGWINASLITAISALILIQLFVLPYYLSDHPGVMVAILVGLIPLNIPLWSLIHEAIHKNLFENKKWNERAGRFLSILFGADFDVLRFGHLMHHRYNRDWESEVYQRDESHPVTASFNHYIKMLGGLYLSEVLASFLRAFLPVSLSKKMLPYIFEKEAHLRAAERKLYKGNSVRKGRLSMLFVLFIAGSSIMLYGAQAHFLWVFFLGRAFIISLHDNAYHYGTKPDNSQPAKELKAPEWWSAFMLRFNYHKTHHLHANLPWYHLPQKQVEAGTYQDQESWAKAVLIQLKGPIEKNALTRDFNDMIRGKKSMNQTSFLH